MNFFYVWFIIEDMEKKKKTIYNWNFVCIVKEDNLIVCLVWKKQTNYENWKILLRKVLDFIQHDGMGQGDESPSQPKSLITQFNKASHHPIFGFKCSLLGHPPPPPPHLASSDGSLSSWFGHQMPFSRSHVTLAFLLLSIIEFKWGAWVSSKKCVRLVYFREYCYGIWLPYQYQNLELYC